MTSAPSAIHRPTLSAFHTRLGQQPKAQVHLAKVGVAGEDVSDAQVLHDDHRGEISKGDVRLVVIFLPHLPRALELSWRDMDELRAPCSGLGKQAGNEGTSLGLRRG